MYTVIHNAIFFLFPNPLFLVKADLLVFSIDCTIFMQSIDCFFFKTTSINIIQ